jgi:hypothetical protein
MEIRQKRFGNHHTFEFGDTHLTFRYKDRSGEGEIEAAYSDLPEKSSVVIQQNEWLRNAGLLWCGIGALQIGIAISRGATLAGSGFWALLGVLCLAVYRLRRVRFTVYRVPEGSIFVIQGKGHDEILAELSKRRRTQLRDWYGEINLENDPDREIAKFKWLEKQQALTPAEASEKIAQIQSTVIGTLTRATEEAN